MRSSDLVRHKIPDRARDSPALGRRSVAWPGVWRAPWVPLAHRGADAQTDIGQAGPDPLQIARLPEAVLDLRVLARRDLGGDVLVLRLASAVLAQPVHHLRRGPDPAPSPTHVIWEHRMEHTLVIL